MAAVEATIKTVAKAVAGVLFFTVGLVAFLSGAFALPDGFPSAAIGTGFMIAGGYVWPRYRQSWRDALPTDRQIDQATELGIEIPPTATRGELADRIARACNR